MEFKDERLDPVRSFTVLSFRLDLDTWREFVNEEENQVTFSGFLSAHDSAHLFIYRRDETLCVGLQFPRDVQGKVICVSKPRDTSGGLSIQEVQGEHVTDYIINVSEQVSCPLLAHADSRWAVGVAEEALRFMERQKNEAQVMREQIQGRTFLPQPAKLEKDPEGGPEGGPDHLPPGQEGQDARKLSDVKLLQACDWTVIEWAELVSDFLLQDSSQPVLDGLKPLPSEEFNFWRNRLRNLRFIQEQLGSSKAQQVASIVQQADSVYWATLRDIYTHVQEGLEEAEDVNHNLNPLEEILQQLEDLEYHQLGYNMACVMEEVLEVWVRSEFYCKPCRMVVLLQEICNLFIHTSRAFLCGEEVLRSLLADPAPVLNDVRLVITTLQTLKEEYTLCTERMDTQSWDCPSYLIFFHLDNFLTRLQSVQEVLSGTLQLYQLDQTVLSGVSGRIWTDVVQAVYQDFLSHVDILSHCGCDPTEPTDKGFQQHLQQFSLQVCDYERRLVSVLSRAFEDCCTPSSAAKLAQMFGFVLERPVMAEQLRSHLDRLVGMVLEELEQTDALFQGQQGRADTFSTFTPSAAAKLTWSQQLRTRAESAVESYRAVEHLYADSPEGLLVAQRFDQLLSALQTFSETVRLDWSLALDAHCEFILEQPLILHTPQGLLGVSCSRELEAALRELRYLSRESDVALGPHAARLFNRRDDITQTYLSLSHMVSCYNQVLGDILPVELPLIQDQLDDLDQNLMQLQMHSWGGEDVQEAVEEQRDGLLTFCSTMREARANMDAMKHIIKGWSELQLLQRSGDSLLEGGATESYEPIREQGEELLRLTQVNMGLLGAELSHSWSSYLGYLDDRVEDGMFHLLLRAVSFLSDNMKPQSCSAPLFSVRLTLQETGSEFEPSVGVGLRDIITRIITDIYAAAALIPRISDSQDSYQESLQQRPELGALEQEVMRGLQRGAEEAGLVRTKLDRFSHLWMSDRSAVMSEFLLYSRQLVGDEEPEENPPSLKDFNREIESLHRLRDEVSHLDDITLSSWLQVDLRPFRDTLLSIIQDWRDMYTDYLLGSVKDSLQLVTQHGGEDESSSSSFPLTETILLLEAAGVTLPEHMAQELRC